MELLSNLTWIAVALALWIVWLAGSWRPPAPGRSGVKVQLTALAVLSLILLPVISVSDDLQASHNPAEVERTCVRNDQHLVHLDAIPRVPAALATLVTCLLLPSSRTIAFLDAPRVPHPEKLAQVQVFSSRPPPAA